MNNFTLERIHHFPQCQALHAFLNYGHKFKLCFENNLSTPKSAVVDGIISYGGSTGVGFTLPLKAFGEFYERNHLFMSVPITSEKKISEVTPSYLKSQLSSLGKPVSSRWLEEHVFSFTTVYNLFNKKPHDYFYNSISLNGLKKDAPFVNFTDSCGCAVHPNFDQALHNALMEFLERQALLGSWFAKHASAKINPLILKTLTPYQDLASNLMDNGTIEIFLIGDSLPGYTIMMFYFAHSEKDTVQYSVGVSTGLAPNEALTASLEELYQCYSFLYNLESAQGLENKAGSGYHLAFQKCNHRNIKQTIPFFQTHSTPLINTVEEFLTLRKLTSFELCESLKELSENIYYYHGYEEGLGLHFIKILSPDFFAHMGIERHLNFDNTYARRIGVTHENAYLAKIPFP